MGERTDLSSRIAIEPLVSLEVACELIPMPSMGALYAFLNRNKAQFPGIYRRSGGPHIAARGFEQRFLTETEILKIREMTFHSKSESRFANAGRPASNAKRHTLVDRMIARLA